MEQDKLLTLIGRWRINQAFLAEKLGMSRSAFNNALQNREVKPGMQAKFSKNQLSQLRQILQEMGQDLQKF